MRQLKVVIMAHTESLHKHHMEVAKGMSAHIFSHVSTRLFRLSLQELFPFLVQWHITELPLLFRVDGSSCRYERSFCKIAKEKISELLKALVWFCWIDETLGANWKHLGP
jgi:hypothetical protein